MADRICKKCGNPEKPHRFRHPFVPRDPDDADPSIPVTGLDGELEGAEDWTVQINTRISTRAESLLDTKIARMQMSSRAAYLRRLIYRDLGLAKETTDAG